MVISLQNIAFYIKGLQRFFLYFCTLVIGQYYSQPMTK